MREFAVHIDTILVCLDYLASEGLGSESHVLKLLLLLRLAHSHKRLEGVYVTVQLAVALLKNV